MMVRSRGLNSPKASASHFERVVLSRIPITTSSGLGRWSARKSCQSSSPLSLMGAFSDWSAPLRRISIASTS